MKHRRTRIKKKSASFPNVGEGCTGDPSFFRRILRHPLAHRKLPLVHIQTQGPAVCSYELSIRFKPLEVTAHGFFCDSQFCGDLHSAHTPSGIEGFN